MIDISFNCDPKQKSPDYMVFKNIIEKIALMNKIKSVQVSYIFGDDNLLLELKNRFFKQNHFTDVIAFRLNDYDNPLVEGEVYISLPRAKENAIIFNELYEKEVARLIIHGFLHLIGYLDETDEEKNKMTNLENMLLEKVKWSNLFDEDK